MLWPKFRLFSNGGDYRLFCVGLTLAFALLASTQGRSFRVQAPEHVSPKSAFLAAPEPIYSLNPNDSWNRIFYFLFSRRVETRLSDEFPEGAPFSEKPLFEDDALLKIHVSTRVFERTEIGDRAIDPLYPSFLSSDGSRILLDEPAYSRFVIALQDALSENVPRLAIARETLIKFSIFHRCSR
jgi:transglutaminase-like putative cysteine protease